MLTYLGYFLVFVAAGVFWLDKWVRGGRRAELIDKIPGPYSWPVMGNFFIYLVSPEKMWMIPRKMCKTWGPIYRTWTFNLALVNVCHPDFVEAALTNTKNIDKSRLYDFLHPWLSTGLLTSGGAKWRERRRVLTPAFHFTILQQFVKIFIEQANKLVDNLSPDGNDIVHDLEPLLHKYTLNSICETAMGTSSLSDDEKMHKRYRSCVSEMGELALHRLIRPWLHPDCVFFLTNLFERQKAVLDVLHGFSRRIIKERKAYHEETDGRFLKAFGGNDSGNVYSFEDDVSKGKRRLAMLDLLISASGGSSKIDDEGIREEVDTFVFEGHDTTAVGITFALLLLAENKEVQDKARAEIDQVFDGKDRNELTMSDVQSLTYVERCVKEAMRLYPSVPFISRRVTEEMQLNEYTVPKDTILNVHIFDVHRDPEFWPDPTRFDPDRFLPEATQTRHPFAFVPFSAGPRNCIGQKFAMLELKTVIGILLHNFYLEPVDSTKDVIFHPDLVLRTKNPVRVKFVPRPRRPAC